jgi:hypothetical protein
MYGFTVFSKYRNLRACPTTPLRGPAEWGVESGPKKAKKD